MISLSSFAQNNAIEMADKMRSNGKIYVVVSVLIIIFTGITAFLISQEIRLRKLEKKINENFSN
ncbi:MAG TPA: CcmD family protein [Bacteroidetes bacterium]|nr:CcmD family protein [Bacteroidota bacterium]